jgi:hypothetical protein
MLGVVIELAAWIMRLLDNGDMGIEQVAIT